jgi:hypothetical protein
MPNEIKYSENGDSGNGGVGVDIREQFIKSALSSCRHFNGIQNKTCKAGIEYEHPAAAYP